MLQQGQVHKYQESFPVGIMKSELIKRQWRGAAALSINAFFLASVCAALLKMKQGSQRRLPGIPRSFQPSAVCPSNSSCPLQLQLQNRALNFRWDILSGFWDLGRVEAFKYETGCSRKVMRITGKDRNCSLSVSFNDTYFT